MCGILGIFDFARPGDHPLAERLQHMGSQLQHRGPNGHGTWCDDRAGIGLGHRRLAILDLSEAAAQPMPSACERFVLTFNGEIYNFNVLREELSERGRSFRSRSDTEVLLEAIATWGVTHALQKIEGMFAFAVWDRQTRTLWLARDRFGEKPLYYTSSGGRFAFASELRALETLPNFDRAIDPQALSEFLRFGYVPAPLSIYANVEKLCPGAWLRVDENGHVTSGTFFSVEEAIAEARREGPLDEARGLGLLEDALRASVRARIVADVPVGVFLSAGIDSSLITALMQREARGRVQTFSIGLRGATNDEAPLAARTAKLLGTDHAELYVGVDHALDVVQRLHEIYDEPFADSSQIPTYLVSQLARNHVKVVLTGDAGDELFGGYTRHFTVGKLHRRLAPIPRALRTAGSRAASIAARGLLRPLAQGPSRRVGWKLLSAARLLGSQSLADDYRRLLLHWMDPSMALVDKTVRPTRAWRRIDGSIEEQAAFFDTVTYLPDDILTKVDRATMASGIEGRVPFLDRSVSRIAWRLVPSSKWRAGRGKIVLRALARKYLPEEVATRPKTGFSIPVAAWLRGPMRDWVESILSRRALRDVGVFNPSVIRMVWDDHLRGHSYEHLLWPVLVYQGWATRGRG